jgi:hypothetical protein
LDVLLKLSSHIASKTYLELALFSESSVLAAPHPSASSVLALPHLLPGARRGASISVTSRTKYLPRVYFGSQLTVFPASQVSPTPAAMDALAPVHRPDWPTRLGRLFSVGLLPSSSSGSAAGRFAAPPLFYSLNVGMRVEPWSGLGITMRADPFSFLSSASRAGHPGARYTACVTASHAMLGTATLTLASRPGTPLTGMEAAVRPPRGWSSLLSPGPSQVLIATHESEVALGLSSKLAWRVAASSDRDITLHAQWSDALRDVAGVGVFVALRPAGSSPAASSPAPWWSAWRVARIGLQCEMDPLR